MERIRSRSHEQGDLWLNLQPALTFMLLYTDKDIWSISASVISETFIDYTGNGLVSAHNFLFYRDIQ